MVCSPLSPSIRTRALGYAEGAVHGKRWSRTGEGKRGGIRVIYQVSGDRIYVLFAYAKNETRDLTRAQIKELRRLLES